MDIQARKSTPRLRAIALTCALGFAMRCGGESLVLPSAGAPRFLAIERGNNQTGPGGSALPDSLVVRATDSVDRPVVGTLVTFTTLDGGHVEPDTARTAAEGLAATRWVLARGSGVQRVEARAPSSTSGGPPVVTFQATATAAPSPSKAATATSIVRHVPDPSDQGRGVVITVAVTSANGGTTPPGSFKVTASTGETCDGVTDEGTAECNFSSPGQRTLTATYPGNDQFAPSTSAPVAQAVNAVPGATRTIIGIGPDSAHVGQPLKIFVHVRGAGDVPAFGIVNFFLGRGTQCGQGQLLGGVELSGSGDGVLPVSFNAPGVYVVRGCYTGAPGFAPSEDLATETVLP